MREDGACSIGTEYGIDLVNDDDAVVIGVNIDVKIVLHSFLLYL